MIISNPMVVLIAIGECNKLCADSELNEVILDNLDVDVDIDNLLSTFNNHYNYDIYPQCIDRLKNFEWKQDELIDFLKERAEELEENLNDYLCYDGLIVIISCHGSPNNIISSDYKLIEKVAIHRIFSVNHPLSRTIPRIFIYDCCDGEEERIRSRTSSPSILSSNDAEYSSIPTTDSYDTGKAGKGYNLKNVTSSSGSSWTENEVNPDFRLCTIFGANPGFQSKMNSKQGSYLIYGLTKKLIKNENIFLGEIFDDIQDELHSKGKQQIINVFNNNTRFIKLNTNQNNKNRQSKTKTHIDGITELVSLKHSENDDKIRVDEFESDED